jgi:hypothetical protein
MDYSRSRCGSLQSLSAPSGVAVALVAIATFLLIWLLLALRASYQWLGVRRSRELARQDPPLVAALARTFRICQRLDHPLVRFFLINRLDIPQMAE